MIEGVYKIINSPTVADNGDVLPLTQLDEVINHEELRRSDHSFSLAASYTRTEQNYIVQLMQKFELCFPFSGGDGSVKFTGKD